MCCLPTGSGKTALAVFAAWQALMRGGFSTIQKGPSKSSRCWAFYNHHEVDRLWYLKRRYVFFDISVFYLLQDDYVEIWYISVSSHTHTFDRASLGTPDVARFFALSWSMGANSFVSQGSTALGNLGPQRWRLARTSCWFFKWDVFMYIYIYIHIYIMIYIYMCVCVCAFNITMTCAWTWLREDILIFYT